ncbi:hypothetical protein H0H92_010376 [Tricholoma furcatifolium]|nr:hypothetical protein H0H92_010376 [Tricholoma furcatifolium]
MGRSNTPAQRSRSGNEYSMNPPFMAASLPSHQPVFGLHLDPQDGSYGMRSATGSSALTSSLSGAIDDTAHRNSRSPPARHDSLFHSSNNWATSQSVMLQAMPPHSTFPGVSGIPLPYEMSANSLGYESATMRDSSPDSNSSGSSNFGSAMFDPYAQQHSMRHNVPPYNAMATQPPHQSVSIEEQFKTELVSLRQKLREAEAETARYRVALEELRAREAAPKTLLQTVPTSAAFQEDWNARTEIRKKMFCSLNRAGNALCAWHDSRRERRSFPPRNAPPGYLNCGCTHEEALFEESLARHQVGSYYPGESVRMDPALRNPLLKLLQQRYGYKDGDFDRNPVTGEWSNGDNAAYWEAQAHAGSSSRRRVEADRH